jgi:hypothetical protein
MEGEEMCLAVIGISVLTVGLYLQLMKGFQFVNF